MADMAPREEDMPEKFEADICPSWAADMLDILLCMADIDMLGTLLNILVLPEPNTVIILWLSLSLSTTGSLDTMGILWLLWL